MKSANLLMLSQGFESVPPSLLSAFEAQLFERDEPLDAVKPHEAACVTRLVSDARAAGATDPRDFDGFAYSFRIPQVSSEFDLLKIAADAVVNVELKAVSVGEERIRRQLTRNRYYLGPLGKRTFTFTYVLEPRALYELADDGTFASGLGTAAAPPAFLVSGSAGTGKTLLLYDLARSLRTDRPVCVV
ncbi:MAG: hypothetical protein U0J70_12900, partial [Atopobiaceae bacterium]|nr:hypothetical protein [Atopobiaceae bacterium]